MAAAAMAKEAVVTKGPVAMAEAASAVAAKTEAEREVALAEGAAEPGSDPGAEPEQELQPELEPGVSEAAGRVLAEHRVERVAVRVVSLGDGDAATVAVDNARLLRAAHERHHLPRRGSQV